MERYRNSDYSGVRRYEIGDAYIKIWFHDAGPYVYSYRKPGRLHVEKMKKLAQAGQGLATYINKYVRGNYEAKK
ncbi:MAG: hypothetical protein IBJ09_04905 [Bacteroidia bacterium]|nr:hypothetical protein [Bacteroidia bacterium]